MTKPRTLGDADQAYLRDVQYRDGTNLDARAALHQRFSTSPVAFADFAARLVAWRPWLDVLECGAGTGLFWTNGHAPKSLSITLTDLSLGMVETAMSRATACGFEHVQGRRCDVQDLPYADESFDVVIANHMLYHVPDSDLALREFARVLRPDGMLLAATNGHGHMREMQEAIAEVFGGAGESLYDVFGIDSGEARLREQFGSITWHAYDNDLHVDDPAAAVAYGLSFPPGGSATPAEADLFASAIERRFVDGCMRIRTRSGAFVCTGKRNVS